MACRDAAAVAVASVWGGYLAKGAVCKRDDCKQGRPDTNDSETRQQRKTSGNWPESEHIRGFYEHLQRWRDIGFCSKCYRPSRFQQAPFSIFLFAIVPRAGSIFWQRVHNSVKLFRDLDQ